jgi:hypothetical protein
VPCQYTPFFGNVNTLASASILRGAAALAEHRARFALEDALDTADFGNCGRLRGPHAFDRPNARGSRRLDDRPGRGAVLAFPDMAAGRPKTLYSERKRAGKGVVATGPQKRPSGLICTLRGPDLGKGRDIRADSWGQAGQHGVGMVSVVALARCASEKNLIGGIDRYAQ